MPGFISRLIGMIACLVGAVATALAADYWQVQSGNLTVAAEGRKPAAAEAATMIVRLQHAVRLTASWPAEYPTPAVLAFSLSDDTIDRYFDRPRTTRNDRTLGRNADQGISISMPQLTVIVFNVSGVRGREFDQLKLLYGRALLDTGPTAQWPECVRLGMVLALTSADLSKPHHLYVPSDTIRFPVWADTYPFAPREFLNPAAAGTDTEFRRDREAYSCYTLALMALQDKPVPRTSFTEYFRLIGAGTDFDQSAQSALGISDVEFTKQLREFARTLKFQPRFYEMHINLAGDVPAWPEAEPISVERMHNILSSLAARLKGTATP